MAIKRADRVGPLIFEELSRLLIYKLEDPRLEGVTFTRVVISKDLRIAKAYFSLIGEQPQINDAEVALNRAKGLFKKAIGANLHLRYMPELQFHYDKNLDYAEKINRIIADVNKENE